MAKKILGIKDVAWAMKVVPKTVREWAQSGKIPMVKKGKSWIISEEDFLAWAREKKIPPAQRFLSITEVARMLNVSYVTIKRWIEKEGLPALRVGRLWRVEKGDLEEWLESKKVGKDVR